MKDAKQNYVPFVAGHLKNTEPVMYLVIEPHFARQIKPASLVLNIHAPQHHEQVEGLGNSIQVSKVRGGEVSKSKKHGERVSVLGKCEIKLNREPGQIHQMSLEATPPRGAKRGTKFIYHIKQLDREKRVVGGITAIFEKG